MTEPRNSQTFDDILALCLDDLLRGNRTLAECLDAYPNDADELRPALQIALLTIHLKSPEMPEDRVDALERRLRTGMSPPVPIAPARSRTIQLLPLGLSRLAAVLLIGFILALGSGAGLVAASADDLPGDTLYGVKRLWESIVLALAPVTGQPGDLWLQIADTRLDEVNRLNAEGRLTADALADLYTASYYVSYYGGDASRILAYFNKAYLALFNRIQPPVGAEILYSEVVDAVNPDNRLSSSGAIIPLPDDQPPSLSGVPEVPTATPTDVFIPPTHTPSPTPSETPTPTNTASPTPTASDTPTPRIPATATRTPTYTPSPTETPTYTPSPTLTWTPLPLPGSVPGVGQPATQVPPGTVPTDTPVILPTQDATLRVRATLRAVYMTQTAEAQSAGASGNVP